MGWGAGLVLLALQAISLCSQSRVADADNGGNLINGLCNSVQCGKGSCTASLTHAFGFVCECDPGWAKLQLGDYFQFLPCVIPNCTFDYSCQQSAMPPARFPPPPPLSWPLFDPCFWSYCGGGTCVQTSSFGHRCDCSPGYDNLLNATSFPCFKECVVGGDCASLGIGLPIGSPPSSTSPPNSSGRAPNDESTAATGSPRCLMCIFLLMVYLTVVPRT